MGQILLVRHGQASWGAEDYDVLSPVGEEQAAVVGRFLAGLDPDAVVHGAMLRQQRTAEIAADAAGWRTGLTLDHRWNEMDHLAILAAHPHELGEEPDRRQFQAWFEAATGRWTAGDHDHEYDEPYPAFVRRVGEALEQLAAAAGTAVVFTSGGPIASVVAQLLAAGVDTYGRLAPVVVNAGVTKLVTGRRGVTLVSFNEHAHLESTPELLTYR
jgi:broad specificity phosphatase PhoE